jgi:hypothetical protein
MAEEPHVQKAEVEALATAQSPSTEDATDLRGTKARLDGAKTEISAATSEPSGKVEHLRAKSAEKPSKVAERLDRSSGSRRSSLPLKPPIAR